MTAEAFLLLVASCAPNLPPGITVDRLQSYAQVESGLNPAAIGPPNRNRSRDFGLFGINQEHFGRFNVNAKTVMQPCVNMRIGITILAEADHAAACIYNTGKPGCSNGYPEKIAAAYRTVHNLKMVDPTFAPAAAAPPIRASRRANPFATPGPTSPETVYSTRRTS